jgi:hypothetical protein
MSGQPLPRVLTPWESAPPAPPAHELPDGTPHPDARLASHGWVVRHGIYVREPVTEPTP